jgi:hypothetical protein
MAGEKKGEDRLPNAITWVDVPRLIHCSPGMDKPWSIARDLKIQYAFEPDEYSYKSDGNFVVAE